MRTHPIKLSAIASRIDGRVQGPDLEVMGLSPLDAPEEGTLTLCFRARDGGRLVETTARAALVPPSLENLGIPLIVHPRPRRALRPLLFLFDALAREYRENAEETRKPVLGEHVLLGAQVVLEDNVVIGDRTRIGAGACVERGVTIGRNCRIGPRVVLHRGSTVGDDVRIGAGCVIGAEGFGFEWDGRSHRALPQLGGVVIENDVYIGANSTVARATIGNTVISEGTRLDCQVHIGHNVSIGPHCLLAAQVGVAGSARLGTRVLLGGQVGVGDHARVGDDVRAAAQTGIRGRIESGMRVAGTPQMPLETWRRLSVLLPRLPRQARRLRHLLDRMNAGNAPSDRQPE